MLVSVSVLVLVLVLVLVSVLVLVFVLVVVLASVLVLARWDINSDLYALADTSCYYCYYSFSSDSVLVLLFQLLLLHVQLAPAGSGALLKVVGARFGCHLHQILFVLVVHVGTRVCCHSVNVAM